MSFLLQYSFGLATIFAVVVGGYFTLAFREWQKYVYLANRWNEVQRFSIEVPEFSDIKKTSDYQNAFNASGHGPAKDYVSYARLCWGFAEDIYYHSTSYRKPFFLLMHNFNKDYKETLKEYKRLHFKWFQKNEHFFETEGFKKYVHDLK